MSHHRWNRKGGFTLLEFEIAILILMFSVLGITKLVVSHERLLADLEEWCSGDPVYFVVPSEDELERILGMPAALSTTPPSGDPPPADPQPYEVTVETVARELYPFRATATVKMKPSN